MEKFKNKKIAVLGFGVSNRPLVKKLVGFGAEVIVFDKREIVDGYKEDFKEVEFVLGEKYLENLDGVDYIFRTPGIRPDEKAIISACDNGAILTSEIEEFIKVCPAKIYAVTGSDGKTTTTTIISELLKEEGFTVWTGGNIGRPLFAELENIRQGDKVVLELSSFQLMTMKESVDVAVVTNVTPNHLDMHKNMDEYVAAKKALVDFSKENGVVVLNYDNNITRNFTETIVDKEVRFFSRREECEACLKEGGGIYLDGQYLIDIGYMKIKGVHNAENFMAAFLATKDDVTKDTMKKVLKEFAGVEHRCEFIREINGVKYYNDSIASTPTRTIASLSTFEKKVILIAGGYDKKIPFSDLATYGFDKISRLILLGDTRDKIKEIFEKNEDCSHIKIDMVDTIEEAVNRSSYIARSGDIVLLSPACASFDMFRDFVVRGNTFKNLVRNLEK